MTVAVTWARQTLPDAGPSVFLAGPTPRSRDVASWRPAAVAEFDRQWHGPETLRLFVPESGDGGYAAHYDDQVEWEWDGLDRASAILFWIPRDLLTLPGFTTNVEFGLYAGSGRAVLGCPPDCPNPERNRYLVRLAGRCGVPVADTLAGTVAAALARVTR